uniref:UBC core domain-containing protein n=1 Tax=Ciona savignyi TaxID=51511 RepID=H2ZKI2_CIOSA
MERSYNLRSPAVKRLMKEAQELSSATYEYAARPLEDNLFEWHFTFRGPKESDFDGGVYHGRIILPPEYPMKPPSIMLLNANGRFELNKKICLSISGYHPESWQPSWSIRTAILAIIGFMPTKGEGAIGALDYTADERKVLARKSHAFTCNTCGLVKDLLPSEAEHPEITDAESKDLELAKQITFGSPKNEKKKSDESDEKIAETNSDVTPGVSNPSEQDGVRMRSTVTAPSTTPPPPRRRQINQSNDSSTMLIVLLAVAIAILFLRRLDKSYNVSSLLADYL